MLSLPIDYWDYLGWKDTLAHAGPYQRGSAPIRSRAATARSTRRRSWSTAPRTCSAATRTRSSSAIAQTRKQAGTLSLPVTLSVAGEQISVSVPAAQGRRRSGEIWLCPITKAVPVAIGRGENSGHTVTYHNVVRRWVKLGDWTGAARTFKVPRAAM